MSWIRSGLCLLLLCAPQTGCDRDYRVQRVAVPPVQPDRAPPGLATLCVVRPGSFGSVTAARHYDNRRLVGVTRGAAVYFCYHARPGWHLLSATTDNEARLWVAVVAGQTAFVRYDLNFGPDVLRPLDAGRGRSLLPSLTFVRAVPVSREVKPPLRTPAPAAQRRPLK